MKCILVFTDGTTMTIERRTNKGDIYYTLVVNKGDHSVLASLTKEEAQEVMKAFDILT